MIYLFLLFDIKKNKTKKLTKINQSSEIFLISLKHFKIKKTKNVTSCI